MFKLMKLPGSRLVGIESGFKWLEFLLTKADETKS